MRQNGAPKDPEDVQLPPGDPVPIEQWEMWEAQSRTRMALLDRLPLPLDIRVAINVLGDRDAPDAGAR
jgi:hypothetical protein